MDDPKKALERIRKGLKDGTLHFEYANPLAAEMFPISDDATEKDRFTYIKAEPLEAGLHFEWGIKGFGFGEVSIYFKDGKWEVQTERMSRDFVKRLLAQWMDGMEVK